MSARSSLRLSLVSTRPIGRLSALQHFSFCSRLCPNERFQGGHTESAGSLTRGTSSLVSATPTPSPIPLRSFPRKRESTASGAPHMQPEAIFRITYGRSERCREIRRPSSRGHRRLRAFGSSRNSESPLVMPASMGDLAMPCPGLLTRSVSALASAAIFLRVRRRIRLCNAAPIAEILPIPCDA